MTGVFLVIAVYQLFTYITRMRLIREGLKKMYTSLSGAAKVRNESSDEVRRLYGTVLKKGWLVKMDEKLQYSGLLRKYRFLSTEFFIVCLFAIMAVSWFMAAAITGTWYVGLAGAVASYVLVMVYVDHLCDNKYRSTSEQMLSFINIVSSMACASDDLVDILDRTALEMKEPLRTALMDACTKAKATGNAAGAFKELEEEIEYPFFKTVIRNLELASRNKSNYADIVDDCRQMLHVSLENEKKRAVIYKNAKKELVSMVIIGILCIFVMVEGLLSISMSGLSGCLSVLMESVPGVASLVFVAVVLLLVFYFILTGNGGRK